ncbi:hypothetical protein D1F64_14135 [Breoghania sp. L-A4]|nr:hypothetical protein D1F64_14135 [Breoghania sp. L-A4]
MTLLGGMATAGAPPAAMQPPVASNGNQVQVARADIPRSGVAGHTGPLAMADEAGLNQAPGTPIGALGANAPRREARLDGSPLVAAPASQRYGEAAPRLKTAAEVAADEAELRRLAGRAPEQRSSGLWSASVDFLKKLRNSHGEEAIGKIEAEPRT